MSLKASDTTFKIGVKIFLFLSFAIVLFLLIISFTKPLAQDEGVFLTIAKGVTEGKLSYQDFFDHKPFGIYYLFAPFTLLDGILALKIFYSFVAIITGTIAAIIAEKMKEGSGVFAFLFFLYALIFFEGNFLIAEPMVAFLALASILLVMHAREKKDLFLIGVMAGSMLLFKQTALFSFIPVLAYVLFNRKDHFLIFLLGSLTLSIFSLLFIFFSGGLAEAMNQVVFISVSSYPPEPLFESLAKLSTVLKRTWPVFLSFLLAWRYFKLQKVLLFLILIPLPFLFFRHYPHYWLQVLPVICLFAGIGFSEVLEWTRRRNLHPFGVILMAIFVFTFYKNYQWYYWIYKNINLPGIKEQKEVAREINALGIEYILAENQFTAFYFALDKKPLTKYLYLTEVTEPEGAEAKTIKSLNSQTVILWPVDSKFAYAKDLQSKIFQDFKPIKTYEKLGLVLYVSNER